MGGDWTSRTCPDCGEQVTADTRDIETEMRRHRAYCTPENS